MGAGDRHGLHQAARTQGDCNHGCRQHQADVKEHAPQRGAVYVVVEDADHVADRTQAGRLREAPGPEAGGCLM